MAGEKASGTGRDIVVIGASAGGIDALRRLVAAFPDDLPAVVLVTVHVPPYAPSLLPDILSRAGPVPAAHPQDGETLQGGRIYVAPPNRHLLVERGRVRLSLGGRVNRARPAIDTMFLSAARTYGPRVIGVLLSGALDDGTAGLMGIKRRGGLAVVQDPREALFASMPQSALDHVAVDHVLPVSQMAPALTRLIAGSAPHQPQDQEVNRVMTDDMPPAEDAVERDIAAQEEGARDGMLTVFTCPECGGALWQANASTLVRFRCHTGHTMSADTLFVDQAQNVEKSLWYAARGLRDKARLARQLARAARAGGSEAVALRFEAKAQADDAHAETLERMIESNAAVNQVA